MPDYSRSKIYKLTNDVSDLIYIGSTTKKYLSERMAGHRSQLRAYKQGKRKSISTAILVLEHSSCEITLIEKYPCNSVDELRKRERYWIENTSNCCNKNIPSRTQREWVHVNIEKVRATQRKYKALHSNELKAYHQEYYQKNKSDIIKKQQERSKMKKWCNDCGCHLSYSNFAAHLKTSKHKMRASSRKQ